MAQAPQLPSGSDNVHFRFTSPGPTAPTNAPQQQPAQVGTFATAHSTQHQVAQVPQGGNHLPTSYGNFNSNHAVQLSAFNFQPPMLQGGNSQVPRQPLPPAHAQTLQMYGQVLSPPPINRNRPLQGTNVQQSGLSPGQHGVSNQGQQAQPVHSGMGSQMQQLMASQPTLGSFGHHHRQVGQQEPAASSDDVNFVSGGRNKHHQNTQSDLELMASASNPRDQTQHPQPQGTTGLLQNRPVVSDDLGSIYRNIDVGSVTFESIPQIPQSNRNLLLQDNASIFQEGTNSPTNHDGNSSSDRRNSQASGMELQFDDVNKMFGDDPTAA